MFIKTVEIVHENWEVTFFYRENEASIFDAKIQVNLCFRRNMQVGASSREMKCYIINKKKWLSKSKNTFKVPGRWLKIAFLSNEDVFPRLNYFSFTQIKKKYALAGFSKFDTVPACVITEMRRRFDVNSACCKFLALLFSMISWSLSRSRWTFKESNPESNTIFDELSKFTPGCI